MSQTKIAFSKRTALLSAFLFAALPALLAVTLYFNQDIREKAAEPSVSQSPLVSPTPAYVPGEVLVKFKVDPLSATASDIKTKLDKQDVSFSEIQSVSPQSPLTTINTQYKIKTFSKVFKGAETPDKELTKFKTKFAADIASGKRKINEAEFLKTDLSKTYTLTLDKDVSVKDAVQLLKDQPDVEYAEPNYQVRAIFTPNDTLFPWQWALNNTGAKGGTADSDIDAPEAWDITKGSPSVIVAIIDTGIDYRHPDLGGCIGPTCKIVGGYDFYNNDADPIDDEGHGTGVAGVIAAIGNNGQGVSGVCPECRLLAVKVLSNEGIGDAGKTAIGINYAVDNGAKVINLSLFGAAASVEIDALNRAYASGVVTVAGAGNTNSLLSIESRVFYYPAGHEEVLAVAATISTDQKADYSNYGPFIDLSAPGGLDYGCNDPAFNPDRYKPSFDLRYNPILTTLTDGFWWSSTSGTCGKTENNAKYNGMTGTSLATPFVSGTAALVWAHNPALPVQEVIGQVKYATDPIDVQNPSYRGYLGTGRVNAYKALTVVSEPRFIYRSSVGTATNEIWKNGLIEPGESAQLTANIQADWSGANTVTGTLSSVDPNITITQGQSVYNNFISGDTKANSVPFTFSISPSTPNVVGGYIIPLTLTVSAKDQNGKSYSQQLSFPFKLAYDIGWPKYTSAVSSIAYADLTNDGVNEVILSGSPVIRAYTSDGHLLWSYRTQIGELIRNQSVAVGDVDGDGYPEIVIGTMRFSGWASLYVIKADGTIKTGWPKTEQTIFSFSTPTLSDINGDGVDDIVTVADAIGQPSAVRAYKGDGTLLFSRAVTSSTYSGSAVGDIDNNGSPEIVTTLSDGTNSWLTITKRDGTDYGVNVTINGEKIARPPVLGDIDNTGDKEIIFFSSVQSPAGGKISVYRKDGTVYPGWPKIIGTTTSEYNSPVLADLDGNNDLEIIANGLTDKLYAWHHDGTAVANWPITDSGASDLYTGAPIVGDIDGDRNQEIVFGSSNCTVKAFHKDASAVAGYPKQLYDKGCGIWQLAAGPLGADKRINIAVATNGSPYQVYMIDTGVSAPSVTTAWPLFAHDGKRTGNYPISAPTTATYQILNGAYDHYQHNGTTNTATTTTLYLGKEGATPVYTAVRFPVPNLLSGTTIRTAKLRFAPKFYLADSASSPKAGTVALYGEKLSIYSGRGLSEVPLASRTLTNAVVTWQVMKTGEGWPTKTFKDTADVASIITEIINQPAWNSDPNKYLTFIFKNSSGPYWPLNSYESDPLYAPQLVIETGSGGVVPTVPVVPTAAPTSAPTPTRAPSPTTSVATGSVFGYVYVDANKNSLKDTGEKVLSGVRINLVQAGVTTRTTTSVSTGWYEIMSVPLGTYTVTQVQPAGYISLSPDSVVKTLSTTSPNSRVDFREQ